MSDLVARLQSDFSHVARGQGLGNLAATMMTLKVGPCAKNALMECQAGGRQLIINPNHAIVKKLNRVSETYRTVLLLSAVVSVVNRADTQFHDDDERRFHALLLERLASLAADMPEVEELR